MTSRALWLLAAVLVVSCKTAETPAPAPPAPEPEKKEAEAPPPPAEPALPDPAPLPPSPAGLPPVPASADNPTTPEKVELGYFLFFDSRLSKDGSMSCEACHHIAQAYTSGAATDAKVGGAMNKRNAPSVVNLAYHTSYYWDGRKPTLEAVSAAAWTGQLGADPATVAAALNAVPAYRRRFQRAFHEDATGENVPQALAAWLRVLQTGGSAWDRAQAGDTKAMSDEAQAGFKVFISKGCGECHVPPLFTDHDFHNAGVGDDPGRKDATHEDHDLGKFKTPSLRNVALTAPYFHDGKTATLEQAIAFMAQGGQGKKVDLNLRRQKLSAKEAKALKAFLESLTGESTYTRPPELP